jgi:hypothetical protein
MRTRQLTTAQEQILRDQDISNDQPGSVLHDFGALLDALWPDGVEAGGKYHLIPMKLIGELDQRLNRPLELELKRPQIRSHPYLQALNLLLRASGLGRVLGTGTKARLGLEPAMKMQWDQLNSTERYFNLLEAAFRLGRAEMVGEKGRTWGGLLWPCLVDWEHTPDRGHKFERDRPDHIYLHGVGRNWYLLALMDLFGLMAVDQPRARITTWHPAGLRHTPFGDAMMTLFAAKQFESSEGLPFDGEDGEAALTPSFGAWQPLFQPFFPEWRRNMEFPSHESRAGMFIFRVSVAKVRRLIALPSDATLEVLAEWILKSVEFDSDHLYEFRYRDRRGAACSIHHPDMDEAPSVTDINVADLPLEPGDTMKFVYDFGDDWRFDVKLERIEPPGGRNQPRILERHGEAPEQYPDDW